MESTYGNDIKTDNIYLASTYAFYTTCLTLCQAQWGVNQAPALRERMQLRR